MDRFKDADHAAKEPVMSERNKAALVAANAAISKGDNEGFLSFCTDDVVWTTVGESTLKGKEAVRQWMSTAYVEPPDFSVDRLIADGDVVAALGDITIRDDAGTPKRHAYCDVWRFRDGRMAELKAYVVET